MAEHRLTNAYQLAAFYFVVLFIQVLFPPLPDFPLFSLSTFPPFPSSPFYLWNTGLETQDENAPKFPHPPTPPPPGNHLEVFRQACFT